MKEKFNSLLEKSEDKPKQKYCFDWKSVYLNRWGDNTTNSTLNYSSSKYLYGRW